MFEADRPTQDLDVCCRFTPANLLKLQAAMLGGHRVKVNGGPAAIRTTEK